VEDETIEFVKNVVKRVLSRAGREVLRAVASGRRSIDVDLSDELPFEGSLRLRIRLGGEDEEGDD